MCLLVMAVRLWITYSRILSVSYRHGYEGMGVMDGKIRKRARCRSQSGALRFLFSFFTKWIGMMWGKTIIISLVSH